MDISTIGYLDAWFYYFGQEPINMSVLHTIRLLDPVQPEALTQALQETMTRFPVLRMGLAVRDNLLCYVENRGPLPVFPERETPCLLGSEKTGGYLFRLGYGVDTITFSFSHGMTDGSGMLTIMEMLLDQYFRRVDPAFQGKTYDAVEDRAEPISLSEDDASIPEPKLDIYQMPGMVEDFMDANAPQIFMTLSEAALMEQVRKVHTSPIPYLSALLAHAVHQLYPVGEMPLLFQIPVDFRSRFGVNTCRNFAPAVMLPYAASLEQLPLEERCAALRAKLREQVDTRRLRQKLYLAKQEFMSIPKPVVPPAQMGRMFHMGMANTFPASQTATVSYLRMSFTPEIWKRLRDARFYLSFPPYFFVVMAMGNGQVCISTKCAEHSAQLCDAFAQLLRDQGIPLTVETERPQFDRLDLERFG